MSLLPLFGVRIDLDTRNTGSCDTSTAHDERR
jgi:hypothetical protein